MSEKKLNFKKDAEKALWLSEEFFYMIDGGGWAKPEYFLEDEDAKKVREAIELINLYEKQGVEEGYFLEDY